MKKRISVSELVEYLRQNQPTSVIFHAENQAWYSRPEYTLNFRTVFPSILAFDNPSLVCLKSGNNQVSFTKIKYAEIDTDATIFGTLITLFCGDFSKPGYDVSYTLIAS